jgi:hypothetical protein
MQDDADYRSQEAYEASMPMPRSQPEAVEIARLQRIIMAALDCLNHDDPAGALRVLRQG